MVEVQVRQQYVCNIVPMEAVLCQRLVQRIVAMQVIVPEEPGILLIANAIVTRSACRLLLQQAAHGPGAEIVLVGGWTLFHNVLGTTPNMRRHPA